MDHIQKYLMEMWLSYIFYVIYTVSACSIGIYSIFQFNLLIQFYLNKNQNEVQVFSEDASPIVTIQLPIYNEKHVIERLIDNIAALDYPKGKFEIQVLDDSNDETSNLAKNKVAYYRNQGLNIFYIQRQNRLGYKAGALKEGLIQAKGELIAIFDADFLPHSNFLKQAIQCFSDPHVGVVQARWQYLNQNSNLLTQLQSFQLNVHFTIEQMGRERASYFLQFNGTAGVWRKSAILDAGNWHADTLTEDLDLSYRAQLEGWKIKYLMNVEAPCELPGNIAGLKSQQFRWMKGGAESAKKLLRKIWCAEIGFMKKLQSSIHLLSSSIFIFVFIMGFTSVPLLVFNSKIDTTFYLFTYLLASMPFMVIVYYFANVVILNRMNYILRDHFKFLVLFPLFLSVSMGLSFHNMIAVIQGWMGKKTSFIRTPKFGNTSTLKSNYAATSFNWISIAEGILCLYYLFGAAIGIYMLNFTFLVFHIMLALGFGFIFYLSFKSSIENAG